MKRYKIKFSSVTHAMKGKEIIEKSGYRAFLRKNPNPSKNEGCGYSIVFSGEIKRVVMQLDFNKVKYIGYEMIQ